MLTRSFSCVFAGPLRLRNGLSEETKACVRGCLPLTLPSGGEVTELRSHVCQTQNPHFQSPTLPVALGKELDTPGKNQRFLEKASCENEKTFIRAF